MHRPAENVAAQHFAKTISNAWTIERNRRNAEIKGFTPFNRLPLVGDPPIAALRRPERGQAEQSRVMLKDRPKKS
jgi:hypothetical protein